MQNLQETSYISINSNEQRVPDLKTVDTKANLLQKVVLQASIAEETTLQGLQKERQLKISKMKQNSDDVAFKSFVITAIIVAAIAIPLLIIPGGLPIGFAIFLGLIYALEGGVFGSIFGSAIADCYRSSAKKQEEPKEELESKKRLNEYNSVQVYFTEIKPEESELHKLLDSEKFAPVVDKIIQTHKEDYTSREFITQLQQLKTMIEEQKKRDKEKTL